MSNKAIVAKRRHRRDKDRELEPEVINENPMVEGRIRKFIDETEGRENKGGDVRCDTPIRTSLTEREFKRQQEAMRRLKERGWRMEDED